MTVKESVKEEKDNIAHAAVRTLLNYIGEDVSREGLENTPARYAKFLKEFSNPPGFEFTTFEGEGYDEMIFVGNIPFYSLCEHHLLPFFGEAFIAYIPGAEDRIVGLSKIPRTLEHFSRKPQNQERITMQVANFLNDELFPKGVAVLLKARHLRMEMRGVRKPGAETKTVCLLGVFRNDAASRAEFMELVK